MMPLNPNGKVDRKALPIPTLGSGLTSSMSSLSSWEAPISPTEQLVADLFGSVLHCEKVGRHDDFFALGGHSLLATQIISRVRSTFSLDFSLRQFFHFSKNTL